MNAFAALALSPSPSPARGRGEPSGARCCENLPSPIHGRGAQGEGAAGDCDWLSILQSEVKQTSAAAVARKLGVSRTAVSLCLLGKYPGGTQKMAARVLALLGERFCPRAGHCISAGECLSQCRQIAPTHNPMQMRGWGVCQQCKRNALKQGFNAGELNG